MLILSFVDPDPQRTAPFSSLSTLRSSGAKTGVPSSRYDHEPIRHTGTAEGIFLLRTFSSQRTKQNPKEFYVGVLGGKIVKEENPCYIKPENSWIVLNSGGGPTLDKPRPSVFGASAGLG